MLKEQEVLMVPPSREGCGIDRDVRLLHLESVKAKAAFNQQQQGREGYDLGAAGGGKRQGADRAETEPESTDDDELVGPPSPPISAAVAAPAAAFSCLPAVREIGGGPHESRSTVMYSKEFGGSRAPPPAHKSFHLQNWASSKGEGVLYANGGPFTKENGFVGLSEKRMRNGEAAGASSSSPPPSPPPSFAAAEGKHGGESFPSGGGGLRFHEDCPEEPLRKRVHVTAGDVAVGTKEDGGGMTKECVMESEGRSVMGDETPTNLDEGKASVSEVKRGTVPGRLPPTTPARTEGHGEGLVEAAAAVEGGRVVVDEEEDVYMHMEEFPDEYEGMSDLAAAEGVDEDGVNGWDDPTDMEVDPTLHAFENIEQRVDAGLQKPGSPVVERAGAASLSAVGNAVEEMTERGESGEHNSGRPDLNVPLPNDDGMIQGNGRKVGPPRAPIPAGVEVIEFDDSDEEEEEEEAVEVVYESDGSSTKGKKPISQNGERRRNGYRLSSESTPPSNDAKDDSDSDDCQVVRSYRPPVPNARELVARPVVVEDDDDNYTSSEQSSDSSDVEEVGVSQSEIRRKWEEAAMRRRMGRAMKSAGSQLNGERGGTINLDDDRTESQGLEESVATSTYRDSPDSKDQTETSEARGGPERAVNPTNGPQGSAFRVHGDQLQGSRPGEQSNAVKGTVDVKIPETPADSASPNLDSSTGADGGDTSAPKNVRVESPDLAPLDKEVTRPTGVRSESPEEEAVSRSGEQDGDEKWKPTSAQGVEDVASENVDVVGNGDDAQPEAADHEDLLEAKEKLKLTIHYRETDEAEWASRQQEIQRQNQEVKKLKNRKRQEADRKREMEKKQRERIEELRLSQMKEERNMDIRDRLRGEVQANLERVAATCNDFATLLRRLGIPVEGGTYPSPQQVNAAYKKALFKFHPDRAVASSHGEPRYQVEAEEKFKLIQRLKETLVPVATDYLHRSYF